MPSRAGSAQSRGTAGQGTPAARLTSCSRAAISASRAASSAAAPLTASSVSAVSQSSGSPAGLARQMVEQPGERGGVGGAGQPGRVGERRVDPGHAAQRVQRGCRLVQPGVQ